MTTSNEFVDPDFRFRAGDLVVIACSTIVTSTNERWLSSTNIALTTISKNTIGIVVYVGKSFNFDIGTSYKIMVLFSNNLCGWIWCEYVDRLQ